MRAFGSGRRKTSIMQVTKFAMQGATTTMPNYFDPLTIGQQTFVNRIWMAAMTRSRATAAGVPVPLMADYYQQRATAGLIISEGTYVNSDTCGFDRAPGIFSAEQVEAWKTVTEAVHASGGVIYCQLWHCGRIGASSLLNGKEPLSPSGVNDDLQEINVYGLLANGIYARLFATPSRAMTLSEIKHTVDDYGKAAANARKAGFDGVEIHAASGYLPHQFLSSTLNQRDDEYGGNVENRVRFVMEIFEAAAAEFTNARVGMRVTPFATYNNTRDGDPVATYTHLAQRLDSVQPAYLHATDQNGWFGRPDLEQILQILRPNFKGAIVANGAISVEVGAELLASGAAQAVSFGRAFLANPDLVDRMACSAAIADPRSTGWYAAGPEGYTDYPTFR
jgi:2,4-dienoyl-CoA reductase-like NADH-dependent reductase (Old Yellow Enzyme family)